MYEVSRLQAVESQNLHGFPSDKIGPNALTTAGLATNALGFALLSALGTGESAAAVGLHLALFGLGGGLFQSSNNSSVMGAVPKSQLGTAGGLNALVRNIGMTLGVAISVSIYSTVLSHTGGGADLDPAAALTALRAVYWTAAGVACARCSRRRAGCFRGASVARSSGNGQARRETPGLPVPILFG